MRLRVLCFHLHRWLGLLFGLLWWVVGLSGVLLVFQDELEALRFVTKTGVYGTPKLSPEEALLRAFERHPRPSGSFTLILPRYGFEPYRVEFLTSDIMAEVTEPLVLWLDPNRGTLLKEEPLSQLPLRGWVYRIHSRFGFGDGAKPFVALSGMALLLTLFLGLYTTWPVGLKFRRLGSSALHRLAGAMAFPLLLFSILTGLYLALPKTWLKQLYPEKVEISLAVPVEVVGQARPLRELRQRAEEALSHCQLRQIQLPPKEAVRFDFACPGFPDSPNGWTKLWIDPFQARVVAQKRPRAPDLKTWLALFGVDLHSGRFFGPLGRGAVALTGMVMALLATTGLWRQLRRKL